MKNKLFLPAVVIGVALIVAVNLVINYFKYQQSFALKQNCHDEAIKFVNNEQSTFEKQIKYDNSSQSTALILDEYNQNLNTCLAVWILNRKTDHIKFPSLGDSETTYISDVLTGKIIDFWWEDYDSISFITTSSGGSIDGKTTSNAKDFNNEIDLLFGKNNTDAYVQPQVTPLPNPTSGYLPNLYSPTPTMQSPTVSNQQTFNNSCTYGSIYCTCLYDALHQIDPGNETTDYIAESTNGNNAPMINAYAECNSRFSSK